MKRLVPLMLLVTLVLFGCDASRKGPIASSEAQQCSMRVEVRDSRGIPLARAKCEMALSASQGSPFFLTDKQGLCIVSGLIPNHDYSLWVTEAHCVGEVLNGVKCNSTELATVLVSLKKTYESLLPTDPNATYIAGSVANEKWVPLKDASVTISTLFGKNARSAKVDENGFYIFLNVPLEQYQNVRADAPGYNSLARKVVLRSVGGLQIDFDLYPGKNEY